MKIVQMKKILSSSQFRMIENASFTYSLGEEFRNQTKYIEVRETKQFEVSQIWKRDIQQLTRKDVISEAQLNEEAKNEIEWMEETEKMGNREDLNYNTKNYIYNFQQFKTIRPFAKNIFARKITLNDADKDQNDLLIEF